MVVFLLSTALHLHYTVALLVIIATILLFYIYVCVVS